MLPAGQTDELGAPKKEIFKYRYPMTRLEKTSDFLEIKIIDYEPPGTQGEQQGQLMKLRTSSQSLQKNQENPLGYIFLPMPEDIQDSNTVDWGSGESLNGFAAKGIDMASDLMSSGNLFKGIGKGVQDMGGMVKGMAGDAQTKGLVNAFFASKAVNALGGNTSLAGIMARTSGQVLNPNMELLFNGVSLRPFQFQFDLAPRDEKESIEIKKIIRTLKSHMNPSNSASGGSNTSGLFIKSPKVFQLSYKTGNKNHKFLHKFKPMAMTGMSVNYTGSGTYATYEDATPIHMTLGLSFTELNPVYAEDYETKEGKEGVGY